ncbi:MAG: YggS family pyridoxal phosphate-dependent enzyme, partial [Prevotella sp.]|nr:YggS family pyridoxal phosphate-dependent enzyme [Prevotella sp.]
ISKYHPCQHIMAAYQEGQRHFGESHQQELTKKASQLPSDIQWHFIGHLQTNKVKNIAPYIAIIESVDSIRLMREIDKQAARNNRTIKILLQLHIAQETTKYGFTIDECRQMLSSGEWRQMKHIQICGLMTIASNVSNQQQIQQEFNTAAQFFNEIKTTYFPHDPNFSQRSWGMSHDYHIALQCQTTNIRIGTKIFGERIY